MQIEYLERLAPGTSSRELQVIPISPPPKTLLLMIKVTVLNHVDGVQSFGLLGFVAVPFKVLLRAPKELLQGLLYRNLKAKLHPRIL